MKKVIVCGIITVLFIIATVILRKPMDNAKLDYSEVKVQVVSSETKEKVVKTRYSRTNLTEHEVVVRYNGEKYDLHNAHNSYSYREGSTVTAYLSNGKLYANVEGVRNASPMGIAYFVALLGSFGMFIITMVVLSKSGRKR